MLISTYTLANDDWKSIYNTPARHLISTHQTGGKIRLVPNEMTPPRLLKHHPGFLVHTDSTSVV